MKDDFMIRWVQKSDGKVAKFKGWNSFEKELLENGLSCQNCNKTLRFIKLKTTKDNGIRLKILGEGNNFKRKHLDGNYVYVGCCKICHALKEL